MTTQEAIERLENRYMTMSMGFVGKDRFIECKAQNEAITLAIDALQKQIPLAPVRHDAANRIVPIYQCPICSSEGTNVYCWNCGQRLDWVE